MRAGVANVPGGPIIEIARLSPAFRALVAIALATRVPIFFETDSAVIVDPDGAGPFFEVPIVGPPPKGLNF